MNSSQQSSSHVQGNPFNGQFALPYRTPRFGTAMNPMFTEDTSGEEEEEESTETKLINEQLGFLKKILSELCRDNMCGTKCKTPDACHRVGFLFVCPKYFINRSCEHEEHNVGSHDGYKHTIMGCHVSDKVDCKKEHEDGRPCRIKVTYYHVRAACPSLRGDKCDLLNCEWGRQFEDIRKHVMRARRRME